MHEIIKRVHNAYIQNGRVQRCLAKLDEDNVGDMADMAMEIEGIEKSDIAEDCSSYVLLLKKCGNAKALLEGYRLHSYLAKHGLDRDTFIGNHLIRMYGSCGLPMEARDVFDRIEHRNRYSWNIMIVAYAQNGHLLEAKRMFDGVKVPDVVAWTGLCLAYARNGNVWEARCLFEQMPVRDRIAWNAMIAAYTQTGRCNESLQTFQKMNAEGMKPDNITFLNVLDACAGIPSLSEGKKIHRLIVGGGLEMEITVGTALLTMYGKCGSIEGAEAIFCRLPEKNVVSWTAMMSAYAQNGYLNEARTVFCEMPIKNQVSWNVILASYAQTNNWQAAKRMFDCMPQRDTVSGNAFIGAYALNGNLEGAKELFDQMQPVRSTVTWNAIITAYAHDKQSNEALELFRQMDIEGVELNEITFVTVLDTCAEVSRLALGKLVHGDLVTYPFSTNYTVWTALLHMYSKCGQVEVARKLFDQIPQPEVILWSAMITAYAQNGLSREALELFLIMKQQGVVPSGVTMISVLSACSHAGMFVDGWRYFISLCSDYSIVPLAQHYVCIVDLLGRMGQVQQAEELLNVMPFEPGEVAWMTLLAACKLHKDVNKGAQAAKNACQLDPSSSAPYYLLSNIHAAVGNQSEAVKVRAAMLKAMVKRSAGLSTIEIKSRVHEFTAGSLVHPAKEAIFRELTRLNILMKAAGYVPDTTAVLHDVEEYQKKNMLSYHSEKLAIAYGLISTPAGASLSIVKNLRVCSDCHSAIKFISKLVGREIIVRDSSRFHRFINAKCSCGDYW